jgi:hypothetical protein
VIPMPVEPPTALITAAIPAIPGVATVTAINARAARPAIPGDPNAGITPVAAVPAVIGRNAVAAVPAQAAVPAVYAPLTNIQQMILTGEVKNYLYQRQKLDENMKKAFTIVYKQCTENLKSKLEQSPEWALLSVNCDVLALMELIRSMVFKYEDRMFQPLSLHRVKQSYYSFLTRGTVECGIPTGIQKSIRNGEFSWSGPL